MTQEITPRPDPRIEDMDTRGGVGEKSPSLFFGLLLAMPLALLIWGLVFLAVYLISIASRVSK